MTCGLCTNKKCCGSSTKHDGCGSCYENGCCGPSSQFDKGILPRPDLHPEYDDIEEND
jgi:hypothetical protein